MAFLLTLLYLIYQSLSQPINDIINLASVPGLSQYAANYSAAIYSGYLNATNNQYLHYMFFESQNNPHTDPLILWLNGGPGCSSMLGAFMENGPFVINDGETNFTWNNYSWNTNSSIIYLDQPAGVGFSIYNGTENITYTDNNTAQYNLLALLQWFEKFPNFQTNDFYIAGESYGGVYVPHLATTILQYNANSTNKNFTFNLKGFIIGNGVTSTKYQVSRMAFLSYHGIISPFDWATYQQNDCEEESNNPECIELMEMVQGYTSTINAYDIYGYCYNTTVNSSKYVNFIKNSPHQYQGEIPPCADWYGMTTYLNNTDVLTALNVNVGIEWSFCNDIEYNSSEEASYYLYPNLIENNMRILFYSGDTDSVVTTLSSMLWIKMLNTQNSYATIQPTQQWTLPGTSPNQTQIAGYWIQYESLTFVQFKGIGHIVPQWNRPGAWKVIHSFLNNINLT